MRRAALVLVVVALLAGLHACDSKAQRGSGLPPHKNSCTINHKAPTKIGSYILSRIDVQCWYKFANGARLPMTGAKISVNICISKLFPIESAGAFTDPKTGMEMPDIGFHLPLSKRCYADQAVQSVFNRGITTYAQTDCVEPINAADKIAVESEAVIGITFPNGHLVTGRTEPGRSYIYGCI